MKNLSEITSDMDNGLIHMTIMAIEEVRSGWGNNEINDYQYIKMLNDITNKHYRMLGGKQ